MTPRTLIRRSLRFHWRSHLGVVLGAAIGSAALIGALVVGDSVRESLKGMALARIGGIHLVLGSGDRFFTDQLVSAMRSELRDRDSQPVVIAPLLLTQGAVATSDGSARANQVQIVGVDEQFWQLAPVPAAGGQIPTGSAAINSVLAQQLRVNVGDTIIVRLPKPTALTREFAVSTRTDSTVALRFVVDRIVATDEFGDFGLEARSGPPMNVFVPLAALQSQLNLSGRANLTLVGGNTPREEADRYDSFLKTAAQSGLDNLWRLADAQVGLRALTNEPFVEMRTARVFLDEPVAAAALSADTNALAVLTYLVNLIQAGTNATPYSMVTAAGAPWTPADMSDDEIVLSQWLAADLQVKPGDEIALTYFDPESGAHLMERTNVFRVHSIVPMEMPWSDRTLMPDFPGIEKAESTSDWDAGFPLVHKIRQKDEDYWKQHRGTPKAFVTLAAGQKMWGNRFGNLTTIRFPILAKATSTLTPALSLGERENRLPLLEKSENGIRASSSEGSGTVQSLSLLPPAATVRVHGGAGEGQGEGERPATAGQTETPDVVSYENALEKTILANLKPEDIGLRFESVRERALKAAAQAQDFGGLFLGFSFFVIIAALLLMALLFSLGLEQRAPEIGTLLALGFTPKQVRNLLLREGVVLAFIGGVLGALGGLAYARAMLRGLTTIWRDAVGATVLEFYYTNQTLAIGILAATVVCVFTIWLNLRKFVRRPARELLVGEVGAKESGVRSPKSKVVAAGAMVGAVVLVGWAMAKGDTANAGIFFGAGALVLIAGLSFAGAWLARRTGVAPVSNIKDSNGDRRDACPTLGSLAVRGCARRRKRSLSTMAMLACGSFLIVSIGVFRLDANRDAWAKDSGTGGFALIGETAIPVVQDLNTQSGREFYALNERDLAGVSFVPFRVREGDEASCLSLNRAQKPRLLGVKPEMLEGRFTFAKLSDDEMRQNPWRALKVGEFYPKYETPLALDEVAAIGDANSIQWAMGKKVGDTIDYVDERGQPFKVRIVGAVANSILQGQLIIDEAEFVKRFPGESGYRTFLIDAPSNNVAQVSATLSRAMQDVGLELTPAALRLAQFNAVQNTYLGTFQVLGGLGLLLGSVGLGIVVLRNVLERRGELALLMAVGFKKINVQKMLLIENGALLMAGLALGVAAAAVAVLPTMLSPGSQMPYISLAITLCAVLANGALWTWVATKLAVRGDLLAALRNE
ncbi:MAG TPA: ABC transporter permease [Verrucomicrobiota bacterium]|nr:ABC transporter permease [Verrucomicrobiota bacterium]